MTAGRYHNPDRIGRQSRKQARCPVHGHHPQSGQHAACTFTHETDPADHRPGHCPDHRDQRDAVMESAVSGDLRNYFPENDVQCHQQHNRHDQRLEHGRRIAAPPTQYSRREHPVCETSRRNEFSERSRLIRRKFIADVGNTPSATAVLSTDATDIIAA